MVRVIGKRDRIVIEENIKMIKKTVKVFIDGLMVINIKVNFRTIINMDLVK